jgi:hypothetical protein
VGWENFRNSTAFQSGNKIKAQFSTTLCQRAPLLESSFTMLFVSNSVAKVEQLFIQMMASENGVK